MKDSFCYIFRFCCDPGFNDKLEIETLKRMIHDAAIDDVAVFCNVEEINTGHMSFEEQEAFLKLLEDVREAAEPLGVSVSVNHWHSLMHADLGKKRRPEQNFRSMVDPDGREAEICVCPMCENWQVYFCGLYRRYAALKPNIIWVEDDFRLHNHDPLHWGGCFCEAHMEEYSRRAGKKLTREEFIAGILAKGEPHPYRKIWLDVHRETMRSLAKRIGEAVHAVSPETKVGLMSSVPYIHSAEGRDWKGILRGFAGGNPPVNRIHLPCYSEVAPKDYLLRFHQVSMANRALIPEETEVYPELENYPYSLFAKSRRFTRFQILSALPLNLAGITIDLFDLNGSGIVLADGHQDMLREIKPFLNEITRRGVMGMEKLGVRVMLSETSSYKLHTSGDLRMEELYPHEVYYAGVLNAMGISVQYCTDPSVEGCVCAVSGQYFRNLSPEQIRHLFEKNALLLSGDAVETLCEMGLGMLAGVESCRWMQQNGGEYAYEQVCLEEPMGGLRHARASALIASTDVLNITYAAKPEMHTWFFDSFRRKAAPGHTLVNGSILIDPFGHFSAPNDIPPMQLNAVRRDLMQYAFMRMPGGKSIPMTVEAAYLQPFCTREDGRLHVYLVNASHDDAEVIRLRIEKKPTRVILLRSDCSESEPAWQFDAGVLTIQKNLDSLDACLLTIEE